MGKYEMEQARICPVCGQSYTERPAVSRIDGTEICPDCGCREAMTIIGIDPEEQNEILEIIHRNMKHSGE